MARINSLVCVFALAFLAFASTSYGYYGNEEPTPSGTEGQPFKISNYLPRVRLPNVVKPEEAHPEVPYVPAVPKVEKPYIPTTPKVEKPKEVYPEVPYVPVVPTVEKPYVPVVPKAPTPKNYAVQGHVYCQSGAERIPIEGVVTKGVCFAADLVSQLLTVTSKTDKKDVSSIGCLIHHLPSFPVQGVPSYMPNDNLQSPYRYQQRCHWCPPISQLSVFPTTRTYTLLVLLFTLLSQSTRDDQSLFHGSLPWNFISKGPLLAA